jgi:hypothetical protein
MRIGLAFAINDLHRVVMTLSLGHQHDVAYLRKFSDGSRISSDPSKLALKIALASLVQIKKNYSSSCELPFSAKSVAHVTACFKASILHFSYGPEVNEACCNHTVQQNRSNNGAYSKGRSMSK